MSSDGPQFETFTEEAERLAQQRLAEMTAGDEDADLKLALSTLQKIVERPPRAPRGQNDVWGWSVDNEHALQPGTEPRQEIINRIKRSYDPTQLGAANNRDQTEIGALETIVAMLENIKERPGLASHDLKRVAKLLKTIIDNRIGPGDDPSGKPSKYVILPKIKTAAQIALELSTPVAQPTTGPKNDYIHTRSSSVPDFSELEQKYGKSQVYVELQRIKLGMMPLNVEIATAIAEIAEKVDTHASQEASLAEQPTPAVVQTPQNHDGQAHTPRQEGHSKNAGGKANIQTMTDEAQIGIAQLGMPVANLAVPPIETGRRKPKFGEFSRQTYFEDPSDGLKVTCTQDMARLISKYFNFDYSYRQLYYEGNSGHDKGVIDIAEKENSDYYPFTLEYIRFIREAQKICDHYKALSDVRKEADKQGPLSRMRLRWDDHAKGVPYRMAGWEFYAWQRNMSQEIDRLHGKPDWGLLENLKNWRNWGKEPPDYEPHAPA